MMPKLLFFIICFFITVHLSYMYADDRSFVDAFYGTCMMLSLLGQDDAPTHNVAKILIGIYSVINSLVIYIIIWSRIYVLLEKRLIVGDTHKNIINSYSTSVIEPSVEPWYEPPIYRYDYSADNV